ncbi:MAG: polyprenyl synthetase family protein [Leptospiraceae bacterium]|nr:polyprenyl synthetase family protein [Leptospiraceae bacterium]
MPSKVEISLLIRKFDNKLDEIIHEDLPILKKIKAHVIESGGKRIRPLTHYFLAVLNGYKGKNSIDIGAIAELIHAASLLHDDVVDAAELRRGKPTIGKLYGNKVAILAGDYLLACGIEHLNKFHDPRLMDSFTRVIRSLAVGELLQMQWEKNPKITMEIYKKIIFGKTASLFGAVAETAGILCNLETKQIQALYEFGVSLGEVFQIKDDYIDYFEAKDKTGKTPLKDFHNSLFTYPAILLLQKCSPSERKSISFLIQKPDKSSLEGQEILKWMEEKKIQAEIQEEIQKYKSFLLNFLQQYPKNSYRKLMEEKILEVL